MLISWYYFKRFWFCLTRLTSPTNRYIGYIIKYYLNSEQWSRTTTTNIKVTKLLVPFYQKSSLFSASISFISLCLSVFSSTFDDKYNREVVIDNISFGRYAYSPPTNQLVWQIQYSACRSSDRWSLTLFLSSLSLCAIYFKMDW